LETPVSQAAPIGQKALGGVVPGAIAANAGTSKVTVEVSPSGQAHRRISISRYEACHRISKPAVGKIAKNKMRIMAPSALSQDLVP
jgi:hypothetical protein